MVTRKGGINMHCLKKINIAVFIIIFILFILTSCTKPDQTDEHTKEDKILLGFAMDTLVHERWLRDREIFVSRAKELGAEVIVQTANSDSEEQKNQVQYLLDQGIDVLVLVPHDYEKAAEMVRMAKARGVKVISYDRLVREAQCDLYISFDNIQIGKLMAQTILKHVSKGNYLILNGSPTDYNSFMFHEGYMSVLNQEIKNGNIKIVGETWVRNWLYEEAFQFVDETIRAGKSVDAIIAANDTLAAAAIDALTENRMTGKVKVVGHDADLEGCQKIVEGTQLATIYKPIDEIAGKAAEYAVNMAKGGMVQAEDTINDGKYNIPFYKIEPVLVTKENMVEIIINSGFHRLEDIYINVPKDQWPTAQ